MKKLFFIAVFGFLATGATGSGPLHVGLGHPFKTLKAALGTAGPGDTVFVHEGFYAEGNLLIDKPLAIIGLNFPVFDGQLRDEIFTIKSDNVLLRGLQVQNSGTMSTIDLAGIKVLAVNKIRIEENRVFDCNFGIYLSNTTGCRVFKNEVRGPILEEQNIGNGIHLWKCDSAAILENHITGQRDGIYFEFVTNSEIQRNLSEKNMRYGLHFMFSHNDHYSNNTFRNNGAGVAVMYSRQVQMFDNHFEYNWGSAAYGILLKDISDSHIWRNYFEHNSAGIYLEGASRIVMEENVFKENGWALRVQASCDANTVRRNDFLGNSFDVSTNGSLVLNTFDGNYWDRYEGYDLDKNGTGDVPFRPVSLYAVVVERMPFGLMLMRSFMVYLLDKAEKIMPSLTPEKLLDQQPTMKPNL